LDSILRRNFKTLQKLYN